MKLIGQYKNGNFVTRIFDDGTKIRETEDDEFIPTYAENCDCKITNQCDIGCIYCHEGSTKDGIHGEILNQKFLDTLHPYTEMAIGGGNALSHPDLIPFLEKLKEKKVIANITVNQYHFEENFELLQRLTNEKLIYGLGVSLCEVSSEFICMIKKFPNAVIHVINGIVRRMQTEKLECLGLKILILGYKNIRRGETHLEHFPVTIKERQDWLYDYLPSMIHKFDTVSFDNLAIEQLNVRRLISDKEWEEFYMGDDGSMTFYIDLVEQKFAKSSTADFRDRYDLKDSIDDMFSVIVNEKERI